MTLSSDSTALVLVDFINEIIHPDGKLAGKGYATFDANHKTLEKAKQLLSYARANNILVVHIGLGFSPNYLEHPEKSPLFGAAKKFNALTLGQWGTKFHDSVQPNEHEATLIKHRVSGFYETGLNLLLNNNQINTLLIAGCATDMAVQVLARDGHDRDYQCYVVEDCCAAANDEDHSSAIALTSKIASIVKLNEILQ